MVSRTGERGGGDEGGAEAGQEQLRAVAVDPPAELAAQEIVRIFQGLAPRYALNPQVRPRPAG